MTGPMSEERERSISDAEWEAMTDQQWLQHRIDRCAASGWTANKERYERILALLSTSSAEREMREHAEAILAAEKMRGTGAFFEAVEKHAIALARIALSPKGEG